MASTRQSAQKKEQAEMAALGYHPISAIGYGRLVNTGFKRYVITSPLYWLYVESDVFDLYAELSRVVAWHRKLPMALAEAIKAGTPARAFAAAMRLGGVAAVKQLLAETSDQAAKK